MNLAFKNLCSRSADGGTAHDTCFKELDTTYVLLGDSHSERPDTQHVLGLGFRPGAEQPGSANKLRPSASSNGLEGTFPATCYAIYHWLRLPV